MTASHNDVAVQYDEDALPQYTPMPWSLKEIRAAIPPEFFVRDTAKGLTYFARDVALVLTFWKLATYIDPFFAQENIRGMVSPVFADIARWMCCWWFQGLAFTGIWVIGHECGHGAFSDHKLVNDLIGFITHTTLWTPYFSWKISHHRHHSNHGSMERDEVYVPKTREDFNIPELPHDEVDWDEIFGDTPIYTILMLVRQQLLAFPAYLLFNVSGQKTYPKWTNHFDPNSILFTREQRNVVIISNIGIAVMVWAVTHASSVYGAWTVFKYYGIPWLEVTHWFIMITFLHHTDPQLPHYRGNEWNFQRGAAATVDRDFLGWQGRFFLHDVAHYHVIHHFFPKMPFYHGPGATRYLKAFIGDHYHRSNEPIWQALWNSHIKCVFVDNEGSVIFYRDKKGHAARRAPDQYRVPLKSGLKSD
ncbi:hypothetical protein CVT24_008290 [Panaeolus cyanescens]|uniref:Fatty acid desaturase domain-containing protein n=1 Tax=Panaeolus cyanescens TaxID=181874 RepID=A0A409W0M4_9AGAR|nr:hypothetical protein CVT24_008290 [Panaeolus cyanescens]